MPRIARVVVPNLPHHVTQRGNRRQRTFFREHDFELYKQLMVDWCQRCEVQIWCYCLMPNHTHLILVPRTADGLAHAVGQAHRRYTLTVNRRKRWTGYLWQGRFASFPMDAGHLLKAVRYVLLNPVRAGLTGTAAEWPHSSARAHLANTSDGVVDPKPLAARVSDWTALLAVQHAHADCELLRRRQRTGRPLGSEAFLRRLEALTDRRLRPRKAGRKPKTEQECRN